MEASDNLIIKREKWGEWEILILNGNFVVKSFSLMREHFAEIEAAPGPKVAIDLSQVGQIDSSALTVLLNFQKRLREKNGQIVIIGPSAEIRETLFLVGFNLAVPVYDTREHFEKSAVAK
jgi:anti-anti-sigma factor